jgi:hypothetical protein
MKLTTRWHGFRNGGGLAIGGRWHYPVSTLDDRVRQQHTSFHLSLIVLTLILSFSYGSKPDIEGGGDTAASLRAAP